MKLSQFIVPVIASFATFTLQPAAADYYPHPTEYTEEYLPLDLHVITSKSIDGSAFEIEDKSCWKVLPQDRATVIEWQDADVLRIFPNTNCFPSTKYYVLNVSTNTYANVDLFLGPMAGLEHYKRIVYIDFPQGEVVIENDNGFQSVWRVASSDISLLTSWAVNHSIIVGSSAPGWLWNDSSDCILINVDKNRYVQARQVK